MSNNNRKKKTPKKTTRIGNIQFNIEILINNSKRTFSVYQADSSEEAARKLVLNLKLSDDLIQYFTAYIEEKRWDPETSRLFPTSQNNTSPQTNYQQGKYSKVKNYGCKTIESKSNFNITNLIYISFKFYKIKHFEGKPNL